MVNGTNGIYSILAYLQGLVEARNAIKPYSWEKFTLYVLKRVRKMGESKKWPFIVDRRLK